MSQALNVNLFKRSVFISHASKNFSIANEIQELLEGQGVSCWIAPRDIPPGYQYGVAIVEAIRECTMVLLLLTEESNVSKPVENEIERAFGYQKTVVPIRLRQIKPSTQLEFFISNAQWIDAIVSPLKHRIEQIVNVVHAIELNKSIPQPTPEVRSILGTVELSLERWLRHKILYGSLALLILTSLVAGVFWMQLNSRGELSGATSSIGKSASRIEGAAATLEHTSTTIKGIDLKLDLVKRESSTDPRKELANRGILWESEKFLDAIVMDDIETIGLFIDGKMPINTGNIGAVISGLFEKEAFIKHQKTFEFMKSKGVDFISDFKDPNKRQYHHSSPLWWAQNDYDVVDWLLKNNDHSDLKTYGGVLPGNRYSSYEDWCNDGEYFKGAKLLVEAGVPIVNDPSDITNNAYTKAYRLYKQGTKECKRYVELYKSHMSGALIAASEKMINAEINEVKIQKK